MIAFAIWLSSLRHLERATLSGDLVLPGLEQAVNTVTEIRLRKGDGTHATLRRARTSWGVSERGWPAQRDKVRKLLLDLGALNVVEEKTRLPANYAALGVEDVSSAKATGTQVDLIAPGHTWVLVARQAFGHQVRLRAPRQLSAELARSAADHGGRGAEELARRCPG